MPESLTPQQARKLVLLSQRLPTAKRTGSALDATLSAINHLGYIQIDTISAIQRAHHHTWWNRNPRYDVSHPDQLIAQKQVFEYWSHAAAYLPMQDYRFSLPRKRAIVTGEENHWHVRDKKLVSLVRRKIEAEGPLMAKDFEHTGKKSGAWGGKPAKRALDCLFMQGELMISARVNFHKVYDLTERVLPDDVDTTMPTREEHARFLVTRYLQANGLGKPAEIAYLLKNTKPLVTATLQDMVLSGELVQVNVADDVYYALPDFPALLNKSLSRRKVRILSPFDNLVIQRKRMQALFDFDYQIECYVPEAKRKFGYFCLPVLWDGRLVARMDCKADRTESRLEILHLAFESDFTESEAFDSALGKELASFLGFNNCDRIRLHRTSPTRFKPALKTVLKRLVT